MCYSVSMAYVPSPDEIQQRLVGMTLTNPASPLYVERSLSVADRRKIFDDLLEKHGVEPAEELLRMATATRVNQEGQEIPVLDTATRIDIWKELLSYRMPKLKAVQLEGKVDTNINITIVRYGDDGTVRREKTIQDKAPIDVEVKSDG
jgi:hypothetical protein